MKKTTKAWALVLASLVVWAVGATAQAVHLVDNTNNAPSGANVHATLQDAHDAAVAGDIIHIIGSPTPYGGATLSKPLSIYGIGINPPKDLPDLSTINTQILLQAGASGTLIEGIHFSFASVRLNDTVSNIAVRKCQFIESQIFEGGDQSKANIMVESCIFDSSNDPLVNIDYIGNQNIMLRNNLFIDGFILVTNGHIANNTFVTNALMSGIQNTSTSLITNNVFFRVQPVFPSTTNNIYSNNLAFGSSDDALPQSGTPVGGNTGEDNINGTTHAISAVTFFVNFPEQGSSSWTPDFDFALHPSNPGRDAGADGTDMGIFGGTTPFDLSVDLPMIQRLNADAYIPQGDDLSVKVEATAN